MQHRVELLGQYADKNGFQLDIVKVERIQNAHVPRTRKELRCFLGIASYYRRFIKGFSEIAAPLSEMTSDAKDFAWTEDMHVAFEK